MDKRFAIGGVVIFALTALTTIVLTAVSLDAAFIGFVVLGVEYIVGMATTIVYGLLYWD